MNYIDMSIEQLTEMETQAFTAGDTEKADMLAAIAELIGLLESANETIEEMEDKPDDYDYYKTFFEDCFERLNGHYPCASVTSDYDCSIIFEAISKGEWTDE